MFEDSPRLGLPFIQQGQASKHITHNEALELLDILVQLTVEAFDATEPPADPVDGQVWALGPTPTGEWEGSGGSLAAWANGGWLFLTPATGWRAAHGAELRIWTGEAWINPQTAELDQLQGLGINTSHDAENRLAVASPAVLLTHAGAGHQLKINKSAAGETASLLFQTDWSGRAELGLAGEDDFTFKVSPDGAAWKTALSIARVSGAASLPNGATIEGHAALHRGNLVGPVGQVDGIPTGAVVERDSNANGDYVRFADGTQLCSAMLNLGDATRFGNGTFDNLWRTDIQTWTYPAAFALPPLVIGNGTIPSAVGSARRMVLSFRYVTETTTDAIQAFRIGSNAEAADCTAYMIAIGRWF